MTRRSGVTLVEVLVAIFVMGIGLIALLTLFPIGILRMAQAIRQDRGAQAALNAHANSSLLDIRHDPKVISETVTLYQPTPAIPLPLKDFFRNPMPGTLPDADDYGPSYAVFVDPRAYEAASTLNARDWVTGNAGFLCRRTTAAAFAGGPGYVLRWFTLTDDAQFYNGEPTPTKMPATPEIFGLDYLRNVRFSWAYLLRRPQTSDNSVVDCSIVVFENRGLLALQEAVFQNAANFDLTTNTVTITYGAIAPNVRPGDWIYDATIGPANVTPAPARVPVPPDVQSCFYRVVAVDQIDANNVTFELEKPIRAPRSSPSATSYTGTVIVMDGIVEVFEKGPVRLP